MPWLLSALPLPRPLVALPCQSPSMPLLCVSWLCRSHSMLCHSLSLPCHYLSLPSQHRALLCHYFSSQIHAMPSRLDALHCHSLLLRNFARASLRNVPTLRNFALPRPCITNHRPTLPSPGCTFPRLRSAVHCQRKLLQCLFSANLSYTVAMQCFAEALLRRSLPQLRTSMPSPLRASPRQCVSTHFRAKLSRRMSLQCLYSFVPCYALSPPCVAVHVLASASLLSAVLCQSFARLSPC